jgi:hypothetical protein
MLRNTGDWLGNGVAFGVAIVVNAMATSIPLGGQTPREISARYPSLFTPESFTFSIWALIYLGLALFVIYQALPAQRDSEVLKQIGVPFKVSCVANAAWILAWHYGFLVLSVLIMAGLLVSLVVIYRALQVRKNSASVPEYLLVCLPFSVYLAWISVATIANISAVQTGFGWDDVAVDSVTWTWLKLALAAAIGATMVARKADVAFVLVVAWAAYGIAVKQAAVPEVAGAAMVVLLLSLLLAVVELGRRLMAYLA